MIRIAFIAPLESQVKLIEDVYKEHALREPCPEYIDYDFSVYVAKNYRGIPRQALAADVVVARGLITAELKRIHPSLSVIEVPIGSEMAATTFEAVKDHGKLPIAVIGSFNMVYASQGLGQVLDVDLKQYVQESNEDFVIKRDVDRILAEGRRIIICGPITHIHASCRECHPYLLGMSKLSIYDALTRARREGVVRRLEREKAAQFQAVLNSAHEGIIATDSRNRITVFNAVAAELLGTSPAKALTASIEDILPMDEIAGAFLDSANAHRIVSLNGKYISINKSRVSAGSHQLGHVLTLQKSSLTRKPTERRVSS